MVGRGGCGRWGGRGGVGGDAVAVADRGDGVSGVVAADADLVVPAEGDGAGGADPELVDGGVGLDGEVAGPPWVGAVVQACCGVRRPIALCRRRVL